MAKGVATEEYKKKTELIMMEDMTEGKGIERYYEINAIDMGDGIDKKDDWMKEISSKYNKSPFPSEYI